jgi:hypothetical protein
LGLPGPGVTLDSIVERHATFAYPRREEGEEMRTLMLTGIVLLAGCQMGVESQADPSEDAFVSASVSVPPIDAAAPDRVETASFGAG